MGQPNETCPRCGAVSKCVDWCEVDIGVGVQVFNCEYHCPEHGYFSFVVDDSKDFTARPEAVFRDKP